MINKDYEDISEAERQTDNYFRSQGINPEEINSEIYREIFNEKLSEILIEGDNVYFKSRNLQDRKS